MFRAALASAAVAVAALPAAAQNRTWNRTFDPNTVYDWDLTSAYWNNASTPGAWTNAAPTNTATFNGITTAAGTNPQRINVTTAISLNGLAFNYADPLAASVSNYKFEGPGSLNFVPRSAGLGSTINIQSVNGVVEVAVPMTGDLTGSISGLTRSGGGILLLSAASTYTGATSLTNGVTRLSGGANRLPVGTSLALSQQFTNLPSVLDLNGNDQTLAALSTAAASDVQLGGATLRVTGAGGTGSVFGTISGAGNLLVDGTGAGGLQLYGLASYTGSTTVQGGDLTLANRNSYNSVSATVVNVLPPATDLVLNSGSLTYGPGTPTAPMTQSLNSLSGAGGTVRTLGNFVTLTFGASDATPVRTFAGGFFGPGTVVKAGPGTFYYTGTTNQSSGQMRFNLAAGEMALAGQFTMTGASALVTVGSSPTEVATLSGTGTLGTATAVTAQGTLAPGLPVAVGSPIGQLSVTAGLDLSAGGTYRWQLGALSTTGPGTAFDQISINPGFIGGLVLGGTSKVTLDFSVLPAAQRPDAAALNAFWTQPRQWTIVDWTAGFANGGAQFGSLTNPTTPAGTFALTLQGDDVVLTFTPVPEPTTALGVAAVALAGLARRRRTIRA